MEHQYGIYAWFGFVLPLEERLRLIRGAGFDSVMLWWGDEFEQSEGDKRGHPELARRLGLWVENAHAPYLRANDLWDGGEAGDSYEKMLKNCIAGCGQSGVPTLVLHITEGETPPPPCQTGIERLARLLDSARRHGVTLALENTQRPEALGYVFDRLSDRYLGICYDSGHDFAVSGRLCVLQQHASRVRTLHLHDNNGLRDQHLLPSEGEIDWPALGGLLRSAGYRGPVSLESALPWKEGGAGDGSSVSPEAYLARAFAAARAVGREMGRE